MRVLGSVLAFVLVLSLLPATASAADWKVGDLVEVEWKSAWYQSKILEVKDGKYKITYVGWDKKWDEWVTPERIRALATWKVGDELEVEWKGKWYKSKITEIKDGKYKITYIGWDKKWDEWIGPKRMRALKK